MTPLIQRLAMEVAEATDRQEYLKARSDFIKAMADHERTLMLAAQDD